MDPVQVIEKASITLEKAFNQIKALCRNYLNNVRRIAAQRQQQQQQVVIPVRNNTNKPIHKQVNKQKPKQIKKQKSQINNAVTSNQKSKNDKVSRLSTQQIQQLKPKSPGSAYLIFSQKSRQQINRIQPGMTQQDILKAIGQIWRDLTQQEKNIYQKKYQQRKKIYDIQIEKYYLKYPQEKDRDKKKNQKNQKIKINKIMMIIIIKKYQKNKKNNKKQKIKINNLNKKKLDPNLKQ